MPLDPNGLASRKSLRNPDPGANSPNSGERETPPSVFSADIWLGDNSGSSSLFARGVEIRGWTSVGDKLGGAYIGSCNIFGDPVMGVVILCRNLTIFV